MDGRTRRRRRPGEAFAVHGWCRPADTPPGQIIEVHEAIGPAVGFLVLAGRRGWYVAGVGEPQRLAALAAVDGRAGEGARRCDPAEFHGLPLMPIGPKGYPSGEWSMFVSRETEIGPPAAAAGPAAVPAGPTVLAGTDAGSIASRAAGTDFGSVAARAAERMAAAGPGPISGPPAARDVATLGGRDGVRGLGPAAA